MYFFWSCVLVILRFKVIFSFDFEVKCGFVCDFSVRFITLGCNRLYKSLSTFISLIHSCVFNKSVTEVDASAEVSTFYFNKSE